jgi:energy-coupling factor transporter ATP-binding protein EcfA2
MTLSNPPSTSPLAPLKIEIGGPGYANYKSIDELTWDNVPPLAVLTGLNGAGKTQLLELLAYKLTALIHPQLGPLTNVKLTISGDTFGIDEVAYLPSAWNVTGAQALGIADLQQFKAGFYQQLRSRETINSEAKRARIERLLGVSVDKIDLEKFVELLPDDFAFMLEESNVASGLTHVFLAYRLRVMEELERGVPAADIPAKIGPAPWDVVNETFQAAEFPYRVPSPLQTKIVDMYQLYFIEPNSGLKLRAHDLSSGEITLLGLVLWLYKSQHHGGLPRLFLLDEPDAHLHPSMTRHFINVIKEVLVEQYKVRVILTTHSPSTVALAPADSIFVMSKTKPRIAPSKSKADTIGLLTSGLVIVSPGTRFVLVEDEDDVEFYSAIRDMLSDYGPSRDPRAIRPSPSLVFMPASLGAGKGKIGGGSTVVTHWVDKLDQDPLKMMFRGVIDRDAGSKPTGRIYVLGRYSFENYLYDPFVVYGVLLDQGTAPAIPGLTISQGDEHRLRSMPAVELQSIVDVIRARMEPDIPGLTATEQASQPVTFTNGKVVQYPGWMIDRRGHDLVPLYQSVFGGVKVLSPPRLYRSLRRVRLIPAELADILDRLQE